MPIISARWFAMKPLPSGLKPDGLPVGALPFLNLKAMRLSKRKGNINKRLLRCNSLRLLSLKTTENHTVNTS